MKRIVVCCSGGVVTGVFADTDAKVCVVDLDEIDEQYKYTPEFIALDGSLQDAANGLERYIDIASKINSDEQLEGLKSLIRELERYQTWKDEKAKLPLRK